MSMRGEIISKEYKKMAFVHDKDGKEYCCYIKDLKNFNAKDGLTKEQRARCLDTSQVLGDSW